MTPRRSIGLLATAALALLGAAGCSHDTGGLQPWPLDTDPIVFEDRFTGAVEFQAFGNSKLDALSVATAEQFAGTSCLRIQVPGPGGLYAGGAFVAARERDLSGYTALTFWAKASRAVTLGTVGIGNDNTGTSRYDASIAGLRLTTEYQKFAIPIPLPAKLGRERGLFYFAAGLQGPSGYDIWMDDIKFENLATVADPRPSMTSRTVSSFVGVVTSVEGTRTTFDVDGTDLLVTHMPAYFTYASSNPEVATVSDGVIRVVGEGATTITAKLDTVTATGAVDLTAGVFTPGLAPTPTVPADRVISLFSNAYANRFVDKWSADWDQAIVSDLQVYGNDMKLYTSLAYAGIEFTSQTVDATAMTHFHMDIWIPGGTLFKVKLVDFGADGVYSPPATGGDDKESELSFTSTSTPPLAVGTWVGLEVPLADFTTLTTRAHLSQIVISGNSGSVYVDNIYFHR
jgi:hypothetical protein